MAAASLYSIHSCSSASQNAHLSCRGNVSLPKKLSRRNSASQQLKWKGWRNPPQKLGAGYLFAVRSMAASSDSTNTSRQMELIYDPMERMEKFEQLGTSNDLSRLTLFSPSKINVFLRITDKRSDGFHDLASLFHVISLGDTIKFSLSPMNTKDCLSTNAPGVPLDEKNLIIKALNLYRKKTGSKQFFWIHLDKRVPTGAGLGGGSAYCTSRGEVVQDIPPPISLDTPMVLMKPQQECSTAEVYKRFRLDKASTVDPLWLLEEISKSGISQNLCINDLEPPAFEVLPSLKKLKQRVLGANRGQYDAVFMSGSGSTIVALGDPEPPQFVYDDDEYSDMFISDAYFLTRNDNEWFQEPGSV
ncbi:hypothetical protein SUGI_0985460 [Cryptomeria japonica]|nr:hypothetical protein SUGI_0985460 [Cryptomeria japonica]